METVKFDFVELIKILLYNIIIKIEVQHNNGNALFDLTLSCNSYLILTLSLILQMRFCQL